MQVRVPLFLAAAFDNLSRFNKFPSYSLQFCILHVVIVRVQQIFQIANNLLKSLFQLFIFLRQGIILLLEEHLQLLGKYVNTLGDVLWITFKGFFENEFFIFGFFHQIKGF